ncbi:SDR family oxidoreductase [Streptomyces sp. AK02-01A]|uniref:SDR family oxidoreductase n=1 Tax=Streptomyces sp. AK02-01A TaxID=3028648 RepID=UPI0029B82707|nr:SDR family oxidoreductase [Streptomyces sp. AK02-01A]MDX3854335.1 SDR family oxidoreductase [Streptomyces sp. AK02-01A]
MAAKTWFITGTSTGFGRALTEALLARGDRVAATLRRPAALDDLAAEYGSLLWRAELDVSRPAEVRRSVDDAFAALGRIDVVVSNAGYSLVGAVEEATDEQVARQLDTNVLGSMTLARAALPHLRRQGGGHLIQFSSVGGQAAFPFVGVYNATKWAMEGFYEALAQEVAGLGIATTLVEPGGFRTDANTRSVDVSPALPVYAELREQVLRDFAEPIGDPAGLATAVISAADAAKPPRRLLLGSDAYEAVHASLTARLHEVEAQKDSAAITDHT